MFKELLQNLFNKVMQLKVLIPLLALVLLYGGAYFDRVVNEIVEENLELKQNLSAANLDLSYTRLELQIAEDDLTDLKKSPDGDVNIEPCSGNIPLYQFREYVFQYDFKFGYKKLRAVFTDSTGDLNIDLRERLEDGSDMYSGTATVNAFPEGEQGARFLDLKVYAVDNKDNKYVFSCNYDLYSPNFNNEGDYIRDYIRTSLVDDTLYKTSKTPSGYVWKQSGLWINPEECAETRWAEYRVESYNDYSKDEDEEELTTLTYCESEVGTYLSVSTYESEFRYPQINLSESEIRGNGYDWDETFTTSKYQACFEEINEDLRDYAEFTVDSFTGAIEYSDHWATQLVGDYRLTGLHLGSDSKHFYFSASRAGVYPYSWTAENNWEQNKQFIGHRNNLPSDSFYLQDVGLVKDEQPAYMSFIFKIYTYTGGNHGMYTYETFNYDLNDCRKIELRDMMSDELLLEMGFELPEGNDALWLNLLSTRLGDIWSVDLGELPGHKDWAVKPWYSLSEEAPVDEFNFWSDPLSYDMLSAVSINDDGLTFSFQPYAVDCWACGWPEITISWGNLWDIFTWGDWERESEDELYNNSVISDEYLDVIEEVADELVLLYEIDDLIYGSTYFFVDEYEEEKDIWLPRAVDIKTEPVVYGLKGMFTERDKNVVLKFTEVMNVLVGKDLFSYSDNIEEVTLPIEFSKCLNKRPYINLFGGSICNLGLYSKKNNKIWVESDLFGTQRDHVLIHELGHSVGLNHSSCRKTSIMSINNYSDPLNFSEFEIALIRFLYTSTLDSGESIESGMTFENLRDGFGADIEPLTKNSLFCPDEVNTLLKEDK